MTTEKMPTGVVVRTIRDMIKETDFASHMNVGEVVRALRDKIKVHEYPGTNRVARKGTNIIFSAGDDTFSASIKRIAARNEDGEKRVARHGTYVAFSVGTEMYTMALKRVDKRAFLNPNNKRTTPSTTTAE